jgi:sugar/nucleoside kinase (ribokinase family)
VGDFLKFGIAVAGNITVDEIKQIDSYPQKSELTAIKSIRRSIGGAVSNCAVSLARMDGQLPIGVVALIGDDDKGQFLREKLEEYENINLDQLKVMGDTPFTDVIQDETDHSRTFFSYKGNSVFFNEHSINFDCLPYSILHIGYLLLLDGLDREDSMYGTKMARLLKRAQEEGVKTSIDIVSENSDRFQKLVPPSLRYTNYCIINEIEAGKSVGITLRNEVGGLEAEQIPHVLSKLKGLGVKDWVVIHSPEGSFGYDGSSLYIVPSLLIDSNSIKGTVGAGDAYVSGVLYGAVKGLALPEAMKLGTACASASLFEEDSTSGVKKYEDLIRMYEEYPKRDVIPLQGGQLC